MKIKLNVLYAVYFMEEAWQLITPTTIKNCFVNCGFWIDHFSSSDNSALKMSESERLNGIIYRLLEYSLRST